MVLNYSRSLAEDFAGEWPSWGQWCPGTPGSQVGAPRGMWLYLKTFLVVLTRELLLALSE